MTTSKHSNVSPTSSGILVLNPLIIPAMDYGSVRPGLGWDDLNDPSRPVLMQVQLNIQAYAPGNFVTLYWNDIAVQTFTLEAFHFQNSFMAFSVYPISITEPSGEVYYTVYDQVSGSTEPSAKRTVLVKLSVPGGPDTDTATPYLNDRLAAGSISPPGNITDPDTPVSVTIAPWDNMAVGDELTVIWNGIRLKQPPLTATQVDQKQIIVISKDTLIAAGDGSPVTVNYEIRDIVNNYSLVSRAASVNVIVDPNAPPAPFVKMDGEWVTEIDLDMLGNEDVQVEIPHDNGMPAPGDSITLIWTGRTADGTEKKVVWGPIDYPSGGRNLEFNVDNAEIVAIAGGGAVANYLVEPKAGNAKASKSTTVTVIGTPVQLAAPLIPGVIGGTLDPGAIGDPVMVRIPVYTGKAPGDEIYLSWEGLTEAGNPLVYTDVYTVQTGEENSVSDMEVPHSVLTPLAGGSLRVSYRVKLIATGTLLQSTATEYKVGAGLLLPLPTVTNAPDDIFDPVASPDGSSVHVDGRAAALKKRDVVTLYWTGPVQEGSASQPFTVYADNQSINWTIPIELIVPSRGQTVDVFYEVARAAGGSEKSQTRTLSIIESMPKVITDDFSTRTGTMISAGATLSTDYTTISFVSGNGRIGFPMRDAVPPDGETSLKLPLLHVCYQHPLNNPGTQIVLIDLKRDCSKVECDVYGANNTQTYKTTVTLLNANKAPVETVVLPAVTNQHFSSTAAQPIHYIQITGATDWTLWDNITMTTQNLARSRRKWQLPL
jgi:hypothetical protein